MHFTAPAIAALAALASTVQAKRHVCNREHYAEVAHNILNPAYFCKFYLKDERLHSPLKQFNAKQMTNLCHCFVQNSPQVTGPRKSGTIPKAQYATCNAQHIRAVKNQYKQPINFAKFYNRAPRKYSPVPNVPNVQALKKAATCIINGHDGTGNNGGGSGGQTTKPATTPAATTPAATTPAATTPAASSAPSSLVTTSPVVVVGGTTTTAPAVVVVPTTTASSPAVVVATTTSAAAPAATTSSSAGILPSLPTLPTLPNILPTTTASVAPPTTTAAPPTTTAPVATTTTSSSSSSSTSI